MFTNKTHTLNFDKVSSKLEQGPADLSETLYPEAFFIASQLDLQDAISGELILSASEEALDLILTIVDDFCSPNEKSIKPNFKDYSISAIFAQNLSSLPRIRMTKSRDLF